MNITIQPYGKRIKISTETNLLDALRNAGIIIRSVCGGQGECGKCKIIIKSGKFDFKYNPDEKLLTPDELRNGYVLACLTKCLSDCEIFIPPETIIEKPKIQAEVMLPTVSPNPMIRKIFLPGDVAIKDLQELLGYEINAKVEFSETLLSKIETIKKSYPEGLTFVLSRYVNNVIDVEGGNTSNRIYGLAVDIGTTKIVAYLIDLVTGKKLDSESEYNAQLSYGEDVVSRVGYALEREGGLKTLQKAAVDTINLLIKRFESKLNIKASEIYDVSAAGNTVMEYLFVGENPEPLLVTKYKVEIPRKAFILNAADLGLNVNPRAKVYCLPNAGRFLGGDTIGDILVSGMHKSPEISLLIDIGTNVEVVIGSEGWLLATTAAAGPAFEGWGVRFGMRATNGAIESVKIDPQSLKAKYKVIGNTKPKGICGSGLIDLLSELFRNGIIDALGKFNRKIKSPYVREGIDGYEYVVVPRENSATGTDIVITEKDLANLIDSKSAACAAISVLMKKMRLSVEDITRVYICGAFGSYINPNNATAIGLLPEFTNARIIYLGNGSVGGAYLTLVSSKFRDEAVEVAKLLAYYDLLKDADFMDEYLAGFVLPGKKELFPTWWETSKKIKRYH
ncbi:MAG: ASKHA domain-containing protein [Candidatus Baldrarchaeota archaeon]